MQKIRTLATFAILAACTPAAETEAPTQTATAEIRPVPSTAADGGPSAGLFRVTDASGAVLIEQLSPDGSYTFMDEARSVLEQGQWVQKSASELCFTANTQAAPEICYRESVGQDGIWYSTKIGTNDTAIIERIDR